MTPEDRERLAEMLKACNKISRYIAGLDARTFLEHEMNIDSTVMMLQTIGENASRLSMKFREEHTEIYWWPIIGIRNKISHGYSGLDFSIVWKTASEDIPALQAELMRLLE